MDIVTALIYIILFVVLMVFVFSMALLTPLIGKRGLLSVIVIGFVAGLVSGGFFIAPIYDDLPVVAGSVQQVFNGENEVVNVEIPTEINAETLIENLTKIGGVKSVVNNGLVLETSKFSEERKKIIEDKMMFVDENFKSWVVDSKGKININITKGYNPNKAIKTLSDWLMYSGGIQTKYSLIKIKVNVRAANVNDVLGYLESKRIVVSSVEGPVQSAVNDTRRNMPDRNIIIFLTGVLGIIVVLFGVFFDRVIQTVKGFMNILLNRRRR